MKSHDARNIAIPSTKGKPRSYCAIPHSHTHRMELLLRDDAGLGAVREARERSFADCGRAFPQARQATPKAFLIETIPEIS
ncbi:MAG TPA: hypothetical protein PK916_04330 [Bacteroidota bacterium]|nr:hypothetical protein [Bacteroidota bacterium]